jgi:hypothetical protein
VSTRRLILVALLCGLAILVAGGIQLFLIVGGNEDGVAVTQTTEQQFNRVGDVLSVGGYDVTLESAETSDDGDVLVLGVRVEATEAAAELADLMDAWRLNVGEPVPLPEERVADACPSAPLPSGAEIRCLVAFEAPSQRAVQVAFRVDDELGVWVLDT